MFVTTTMRDVWCVPDRHCAAGLSSDLVSEKYPHDESRDMPLTLSDCNSRAGAEERACSYWRRPVADVFQRLS